MKARLFATLTAAFFLCAVAAAQVDNCCFVDRQCYSDQEWTDGYFAFQNGQCAAPAQIQPSQPQQPAAESDVIDNCCFAGWVCQSDQEWVNGYLAYQNGQCTGPPGSHSGVDSCCSLGWNCTFEFDFIMGRWWYEDNNGTCNQPIQEIVDGVIIEGSPEFIAQYKAAMHVLKTRAPEWHAYTTNIIRKIRETFGKVGPGALAKSFNVPVWHTVNYAAAIIVHETCHVHRHYSRFYGTTRPEIEHIAEEPICDQVAIEALQKFSPDTASAYTRGRINWFLNLGTGYDIGPSVQIEWERARNIYSHTR